MVDLPQQLPGSPAPSQNLLERLMNHIPGYKGYRAKEDRRINDQMLRHFLQQQYSSQRQRLVTVQQRILESGLLAGIEQIDHTLTRLQRYIDRLGAQMEGYGGLGGPVSIAEPQLDALYNFDNSLLDGVSLLSTSIDHLDAAVRENQQIAGPLGEVNDQVDRLNLQLDKRNDVLRNVG